MDLYAVKACFHSVNSSLPVLLHHCRVFLLLAVLAAGVHGTKPSAVKVFTCPATAEEDTGGLSLILKTGVRHSTYMPNLANNFATRRMHRIRDFSPSGDLLRGFQFRGVATDPVPCCEIWVASLMISPAPAL